MTNAADFLDEKAKQDPKVRERLRKAERAAGEANDSTADEQPKARQGTSGRAGKGKAAWVDKLICGDNGPRAIEANVVLALREDPAFAGKLRLNELAQAVECAALPWRACDGWRPWTDVDDINLAVWIQHRGPAVKPATCAAAVQLVAADHPCHPVRAYLDGLRWDGKPRLDSWLETHLGAKARSGREQYLRQVGRKWPISAVARIYDPGCKADHALIEEGPQGVGKSSALAALVPDRSWFADEISDLGSKDSAQDLRGKWIIEIPELSAMRRSDIERTKAFVTRAVDHYRPSYGRRSVDHPRQCVFAGTTNADAYLGDETGGRRFWPAKVGAIDLDALRRDRDQLWAEAVAAYKAGEKWWLEPEVERAAAEEQAERRVADPWEGTLLEWAGRQVEPVGIPEALTALSVPTERHDQAAANRVARIFKAAGWEKAQRRVAGVRVWVYRPPSQVSQVPNGQTCDGKASICAGVTGVTGVTGNLETFVNERGHESEETGCDTRDTCDSQASATFPVTGMRRKTCDTTRTCDAEQAVAPARDPADERGWLDELRAARKFDERNVVIQAWTKATGGRPGLRGDVLVAELPPPFLNCEVPRLARRYGWDVRGIGR